MNEKEYAPVTKILYSVTPISQGKNKYILVSPIQPEKEKLIRANTPFWEAEIYLGSITYRLVVNIFEKGKKYYVEEVKEEKNLTNFSLNGKQKRIVSENFKQLPFALPEKEGQVMLSCSYAKKANENLTNISIKTKCKEKTCIALNSDDNEEAICKVELDICLQDDNNTTGDKIVYSTATPREIAVNCSNRISQSLKSFQFDGFKEFVEDVYHHTPPDLLNSGSKSIAENVQYPKCLLNNKSSDLPTSIYKIPPAPDYLPKSGSWYRTPKGYKGFFKSEEDLNKAKEAFSTQIKNLGIKIKEADNTITVSRENFQMLLK